jgi:hypothetical protein
VDINFESVNRLGVVPFRRSELAVFAVSEFLAINVLRRI